MSNPSNLYAEKIYSEHPTTMWALDDQADYVSLITESQRDIDSLWSISSGTSSLGVISGEPFSSSTTTMVEASVPTEATGQVVLISPDIVNFTSLNEDFGTFCIGTFFYSNSVYLKSISIGFEYTDTTTSATVQKLKTYTTDISQSWGFISETFDIPDENTNMRIVIKIDVHSGGSSSSDYQFYLNGITAGQWSEEFNTFSLGVEEDVFPSSIAITTTDKVIPAAAYGISSDQGYYFVKNKSLLAKNTSIPLVYGASGVTKILPNVSGKPSLILPGKGFLNEIGRYKEYTVEFWARINSDTNTPKKIFGPISSSDGLYVESGFITLVIGESFSSYFVGEWYRPMLVNIRLVKNSATLLINGEQVISIVVDTDNMVLPEEIYLNKSQDWLGFYAYEDVSPIEIDCFAIYSYQVPTTVAKRRWVYGQGVLSPDGIDSSYGGTSTAIDYSFADYTSNYNYPDFAKWQQGSIDNLVASSKSLETPQYTLPEIFLDGKSLSNFYADNEEIQSSGNKFITFRPNNTWNSENAYINFSKLGVLNDEVAAVYGVFEINEDDETEQIFFKFYENNSTNYFIIKKSGEEIKYSLMFQGSEQEIYSFPSFTIDQKILVGLNIKKLVEYFGGSVSSFFGTQGSVGMYVGGDNTGQLTFTGKVYSVGISTESNFADISSYFYDNGVAILDEAVVEPEEPENAVALLNHVASYTLLPSSAYGKFFLDIGVSGYWEDYLPLSYFAQYVTNDVGNQYYDLDFLQFNIGYPSPSISQESEVVAESWTYDQLKQQYKFIIQKTYAELDNVIYTGWQNYEDLNEKSVKFYEYNTDNASIRSYMTFQYIEDGSNLSQSNFSRLERSTSKKIIDIDEHPLWQTTKFEVVDNTLVYPTKTIDFNKLSVVIRLEFKVKNILTKPISLSRLELASQALSDNSFNPIGTKFGNNIFPYKRAGIYYDYKNKNPYTIYKGSTPHLYLNKTSGIQVGGDFNEDVSRGISIPINSTNAANYRVSAIQSWMRYPEDQFPGSPVELFEIDHKGDVIKFYITTDSNTGKRGRIYALSKDTNLPYNGLVYYWNGSIVREPVITSKEWGVLGISFSNSLIFDSYLGAINLTGPMLFNNISYYQANNLQQVQSTLTRPWSKVKTDGVINFEWLDWFNSFTWDGVLVISSSDIYGVNPSEIYKTYIGANKIIVDDNSGLALSPDILKIYNNTTWQSTVRIPV